MKSVGDDPLFIGADSLATGESGNNKKAKGALWGGKVVEVRGKNDREFLKGNESELNISQEEADAGWKDRSEWMNKRRMN
ncbi:hypothetical protein Tco_0132469 [Tanacetum coccineum]